MNDCHDCDLFRFTWSQADLPWALLATPQNCLSTVTNLGQAQGGCQHQEHVWGELPSTIELWLQVKRDVQLMLHANQEWMRFNSLNWRIIFFSTYLFQVIKLMLWIYFRGSRWWWNPVLFWRCLGVRWCQWCLEQHRKNENGQNFPCCEHDKL